MRDTIRWAVLMLRRLTTCVVLLLSASIRVPGWGIKGHQIIADIARNHLTAAARKNLVALLGNDDLAAVSTWADEVRSQRPETSGWHFVDIPRDAAGFSEQRDCYRPDES